MGKKLARTVVSGGVVYPAGTAATADLEAKITNPDHWEGEAKAEKPEADSESKPARKRSPKKSG